MPRRSKAHRALDVLGQRQRSRPRQRHAGERPRRFEVDERDLAEGRVVDVRQGDGEDESRADPVPEVPALLARPVAVQVGAHQRLARPADGGGVQPAAARRRDRRSDRPRARRRWPSPRRPRRGGRRSACDRAASGASARPPCPLRWARGSLGVTCVFTSTTLYGCQVETFQNTSRRPAPSARWCASRIDDVRAVEGAAAVGSAVSMQPGRIGGSGDGRHPGGACWPQTRSCATWSSVRIGCGIGPRPPRLPAKRACMAPGPVATAVWRRDRRNPTALPP